ncbi:MAG: hypothetical protein GX447_00200 [Elusimicrobia bacterium]|nr:hypothetical protein [Elusimicrobiota bacterium]
MKYSERIKFAVSAAVFGSAWGALEAFMGSYLHMLNIPFRGAIMAGIACVLMSSGRAFAPYKFVTLSAASVACLIKLVGIGAFKLGPMAGILIEGIIAEIVFLLFGLNSFSVFTASFAVCFEGIPHFFITSWIMYGGGIFETYLIVIEKTASVLGLPKDSYMAVLFLWIAGHAAAGFFFGKVSSASVKKLKNEI